MTQIMNSLGQPIGAPLAGWTPPLHPSAGLMDGNFCRLEALAPARHAENLHAANMLDREGKNWTYLPYGPFDLLASYRAWLDSVSESNDPLFFTIVEKAGGKAAGVVSYLRITPASGTIEIGHVHFSELLKGTPAATEAIFLMMKNVFALGYRRCEWKCDALNAPSRAAAQRLGFSYEGTFRQATAYKGRNRDTAWYSVIDTEWPQLSQAFTRWLAQDNFDEHGRQRERLSDLTRNSHHNWRAALNCEPGGAL